jgi:hypothetical protein
MRSHIGELFRVDDLGILLKEGTKLLFMSGRMIWGQGGKWTNVGCSHKL